MGKQAHKLEACFFVFYHCVRVRGGARIGRESAARIISLQVLESVEGEIQFPKTVDSTVLWVKLDGGWITAAKLRAV